MKTNEKDILRSLFPKMQNEPLPVNFHEKVMRKVQKKALMRAKRKKWEIFGYTSGAVAMLSCCAVLLYLTGIPLKIPNLETYTWAILNPNLAIFRSNAFIISIYIGALALLLLIVDSTIRRYMENKRNLSRLSGKQSYTFD
ncbi:MAG: hypothetical protein LBF79_00870 [Dysgonamonadaceae bacterium]|jgi:hypothetical protein|nr:hypothetical protein [Dysgonamonadaceae bacterium]